MENLKRVGNYLLDKVDGPILFGVHHPNRERAKASYQYMRILHGREVLGLSLKLLDERWGKDFGGLLKDVCKSHVPLVA